ncbi:hypothetical protein ACE2AJ_07555 [Aquihabitans daechungensis]|uniref:hypothetical protein n=1 Tax=Aquihabitans daechungensis TaxID=1052257 RepID=UPI003BA3BB24
MIGCYPGSFNPPTVAHLAVAEAAVAAAGLDRLDLVISRVALGKEDLPASTLAERVAVLEAVAATRPWLGVVVTDAGLVTDIARRYDAVVMGADKWRQVNDPAWYPDEDARDAAVAALPLVLVAPRGDDRPDGVQLLDVDAAHLGVNATAIRAGEPHAAAWVLPEAGGTDRIGR